MDYIGLLGQIGAAGCNLRATGEYALEKFPTKGEKYFYGIHEILLGKREISISCQRSIHFVTVCGHKVSVYFFIISI